MSEPAVEHRTTLTSAQRRAAEHRGSPLLMIAGYEGRHDDLIYQAPGLYRLLCHLLDDPMLPQRLRPLVLCAIAYFVLPADVIPEDIYGPEGYLDDIWLAAHVADTVRKELGTDRILEDNWDGETAPIPLIEEICTSDIVDEATKEAVLRYVDLPSPG